MKADNTLQRSNIDSAKGLSLRPHSAIAIARKRVRERKRGKKKRNRTVLVEVLNTTDQLIHRVFCGAMFKHFHTLMNSNQFIC